MSPMGDIFLTRYFSAGVPASLGLIRAGEKSHRLLYPLTYEKSI